MIYRIYVSLSDNHTAFAFLIVNRQDFTVYAKSGRFTSETGKGKDGAYTYACFLACDYFSKYIKKRYYTEHFSERLSEDEALLYTDPAFFPLNACSREPEIRKNLKALMEANLITFAAVDGSGFLERAKELANEKIKK